MTMATPKKMKTLRIDLATHAEITKRADSLGLTPARLLTLAMRGGDAVEDIVVEELAKAATAEQRRRAVKRKITAAPAPDPAPDNVPAADATAHQ